MALLFWYLVNSDASVRYFTVAYTGQASFTRYQNNTAMYIWSPCKKKKTNVKKILTINFCVSGSRTRKQKKSKSPEEPSPPPYDCSEPKVRPRRNS